MSERKIKVGQIYKLKNYNSIDFYRIVKILPSESLRVEILGTKERFIWNTAFIHEDDYIGRNNWTEWYYSGELNEETN